MFWVLRLTAVAGLSGLMIWGETPPSPGGSPAVAVFLDFDSKPGDASVHEMEKEAEKLLKPSGVKLDWRSIGSTSDAGKGPGLVVVKFKGRCRVENWVQPDLDSLPTTAQTLGFTRVENGKVTPFSEVECDQLRKALAYLDPGATPAERQKALGLAMGRVLAHELYHILARTTAHAQEGLAKATNSLRDLVLAPAMSFGEKDSTAMGNGFAPQK